MSTSQRIFLVRHDLHALDERRLNGRLFSVASAVERFRFRASAECACGSVSLMLVVW